MTRTSPWSGVAAAYRRSFGSLCAGTIPTLLDAVAPAQELLDVGCGTGELLSAAAERGITARGVDAAPDMVALTAQHAPGRVQVEALPHLDLPDDSAPAITANFVINHVPDPRAAVAELARVATPEAPVAITIWPVGGTGWAPLVGGVFEEAGAAPIAPDHLPPDLDFPRTVDGLAELAVGARLRIKQAEEITWTWRVDPQDLWSGIAAGIATPGRRYLAQDPAGRERVQAVFNARTADAALVHGQLAVLNRAVLVVACRT